MSALSKVKDHTSINQQKIFWKNQTFLSLFGNKKLVMAIAIILAFKINIAIVIILAIKIVMVGIIINIFSSIK